MSFVRSAFAAAPLHTREQVMAEQIKVAIQLDMPDKRGAAICAGMCVSQEVGADPHGSGQLQFWTPGNNADPCFAADPGRFPHDSMGDDGRSVGLYQQQTSGPPPAMQWGWGGKYGDPEGTRKRMDLHESTVMFLTALRAAGYDASNAQTANDSIQRVQKSGAPQAYAKHWPSVNELYARVVAGIAIGATVPDNRPDFNEIPMFLSANSNDRDPANVDLWLLHTQEPPKGADNRNDAALELRNFLESTTNTRNPVSYHYTASMADDGGTTVIDCVDTDEACWAVGNSNARSINFCFAGTRADWTRQQWLNNEHGAIMAAAYLFVQDCGKYPKLKARVIAPNYSPPPGAADHNYCTVFLKDGNDHTDVGPNFPWDVFTAAVATYSSPTPPPPARPVEPAEPDYVKETWQAVKEIHAKLFDEVTP